MSATDYHICPALTSAYIAKVSKKNPSLMLSDRREITENEILMLIDWYLDKMADYGEGGISFDSHIRMGSRIIMKFKKEATNGKQEKGK